MKSGSAATLALVRDALDVFCVFDALFDALGDALFVALGEALVDGVFDALTEDVVALGEAFLFHGAGHRFSGKCALSLPQVDHSCHGRAPARNMTMRVWVICI